MKATLGGLRWKLEEVREVGEDGILVGFTVTGTYGDAPLPQRMWQAVEGRQGLVVWWGVFRTETDALAALASR